jgi:hypothetical protein
MEHLSKQERSTLSKHALKARWNPLEAQDAKERTEEIAFFVNQAQKTACNYHSSDTSL